MAQLIDTHILRVLLLTLCLLEINCSNITQQLNPPTNTTVKHEKAAANKTKVNVETLNQNTHNGREHITSAPKLKESTLKIPVTKTTKSNETSVKNNKTVKINTTKVNISNTVKPFKPTRTEHDMFAGSLKSQVNKPAAITLVDINMDKKVRRAEYIVPIVAVILSVPLVAVLISLLYKKGKDWWQHRNYRRMDYLIEGMYNS